MTRMLCLVGALFLAAGCSENAAATQACKGVSKTSEDCNACCKGKGANGYKFMNGDCGCLGGG